MYLTGCFIVFLIVLLVIHIKGNLTIRDILISLLCIALSWVTLTAVVVSFLVVIALVVIAVVTAEFWNTPIWKAKKKSKLSKKLDDLLN